MRRNKREEAKAVVQISGGKKEETHAHINGGKREETHAQIDDAKKLERLLESQLPRLYQELNARLIFEYGQTAYQDHTVLWLESLEIGHIGSEGCAEKWFSAGK